MILAGFESLENGARSLSLALSRSLSLSLSLSLSPIFPQKRAASAGNRTRAARALLD